jgi:flagellin
VATADGSDFLVLTQQSYGSANRIDVTGALTIYGAAADAGIGADAKATVTDGAAVNVTDALWDQGSGTIIKDSYGNAIQLTDARAIVAADNTDQIDAAVGSMTFQVGAYAGQTRSLSIGSAHTSQLGLANGTSVNNISLIDVATNAEDAITVLDKAIADVSSLRSSLGATQKNTLESSIASLGVASENIAASESSIRDTDMAAEMVEFTKYQILQQAGTAMLAQANQAPQALLSLLQ